MPPTQIIDPTQIDFDQIVCDVDAIEAINPHRYGMRMLDAIVHIDRTQHIIVGYRDIRDDEFWVPGHMPGHPLLPGVLMCEAAAQIGCFYTKTHGAMFNDLMGLGGIENARFRAPVVPGDRLVLVARGRKIHRRKSEFEVHGYVGSTMVFNADVIGLPIPGQDKVLQHQDVCLNGVGG